MNPDDSMFVCYLGNLIPVDPMIDLYRFMGRIDADLNPSNPRPWYVFAPGIDQGFHTLPQAYRYATYELDLPPTKTTNRCTSSNAIGSTIVVSATTTICPPQPQSSSSTKRSRPNPQEQVLLDLLDSLETRIAALKRQSYN